MRVSYLKDNEARTLIIFQITGLGSLIPQFMIMDVAVKQDVPVLLYNAIIISIVTVT